MIPRVDTLERILNACGESLEAVSRAGDGVDRTLIRAVLAMSPAERLRSLVDEAAALERISVARRR